MALVLFSLVAALALLCADERQPRIFALAKPLATLCLLAVAGRPTDPFGFGIFVGLGLSALGDAALLRKHQRPYFLAGMGFFLLAHSSYTLAFLDGRARVTGAAALAGALAAAGVVAVMRHVWQGIHPTLRGPCVVYGLAITAMLGAAATISQATASRDIGNAVLVGAILFYAGDAALALALFGKPVRYGQTLSMGLYWSGQLGFALAARWHGALGA